MAEADRNEAMNSLLRGRGRSRLAVPTGSLPAGTMNRFVRGQSLAPERDDELDQLLALKAGDPAGFYALAPDVRARVSAYESALALDSTA